MDGKDMRDLKDKAQLWWQARSPRERVILLAWAVAATASVTAKGARKASLRIEFISKPCRIEDDPPSPLPKEARA